jgi:hemin uptake protein HemP
MKRVYYLLILASALIFSNQYSFAQKDSSGIYKTAEDFKNRKLSYAINYKTEKHKINSYVLFKGNTIRVKHQGVTYNLKKSETYAYRNTKGEEYRFIGEAEYSILNPGESLLIYMYQHPAHSGKEADKYAPAFYFTSDAAGKPQALTKENLKAAFPDYHKFHDALDANFKRDNELYAYDRFHKMYKLNWIMKNYKN